MFPRKFPRENSPAKILLQFLPGCIYAHAHSCVHLSTGIFLRVFIHVYFPACIYPRAFFCVYLSACIFLRVFIHVHFPACILSMCIFLRVFIRMHFPACILSTYIFLPVFNARAIFNAYISTSNNSDCTGACTFIRLRSEDVPQHVLY